LEAADRIEPEYAEAEQDEVELELNKARKAIGVLEKFLPEATRDWKDRKNRVIGHVVLSPPIGLNIGEDEFTKDWAVIEIDASKIDSTNFFGNVVDLGIDVPVGKFTSWMYPHPAFVRLFRGPSPQVLRHHPGRGDRSQTRTPATTRTTRLS
jgi:hypothetical protein